MCGPCDLSLGRRHASTCPWQVAPKCPVHGTRLTWQTALVAPGYICGRCLESIPESEES